MAAIVDGKLTKGIRKIFSFLFGCNHVWISEKEVTGMKRGWHRWKRIKYSSRCAICGKASRKPVWKHPGWRKYL